LLLPLSKKEKGVGVVDVKSTTTVVVGGQWYQQRQRKQQPHREQGRQGK
jgi:hypothetical protein